MADSHPLDTEVILSNLFYPRKALLNPNTPEKDGYITMSDGIKIGYRLYLHTQVNSPVLLYFHGNGEIASDCDMLAPFYRACGVSLLVVDYRGYGWSEGTPLASKLLPDAEDCLLSLPRLFREWGIPSDVPIFVKGRSLGSASAVYLAYKYPEKLSGLIVDSGYSDSPSLFRRMGIPIPPNVIQEDTLPFNNAGKIAQVTLPTLLLHGELDTIFPLAHAQALLEACSSPHKQLVMIDGAGHGDIQVRDMERYFSAVKAFINTSP